ncbi:MAG: DNA-directed RNA polymerase subunit alpha [Candidatus Peregrinibacteria bacterium]|nr:DNA-directed RNA polymerase subunit alpha [Candidatus Peregrinibacteria bacterium]
MHLIQEEIGIPKIKTVKIGENHVIFTLTPLPPGYGVTLGNALRRVLLSSIPGACITGAKIEGISHEYSTVKGSKDSVLDMMLNLKLIDIKKVSKEPSWIILDVSKEGVVRASDIKTTSDVEITNPDQYITTLEKGTKLHMELRVEKGVGYIPATVRQRDETIANIVTLDCIYSPVKKIRYDIESTRVGQMTNLDKLTFEIKTNGSITPEDAMKFSANILQSYFKLFNEESIIVEPEFMSDINTIMTKQHEEDQKKPAQESYTPIEILGFSPRTLNALINGGIGSVEQLSRCTESKLTNLRGFGRKALGEVAAALETKGLKLSEE